MNTLEHDMDMAIAYASLFILDVFIWTVLV